MILDAACSAKWGPRPALQLSPPLPQCAPQLTTIVMRRGDEGLKRAGRWEANGRVGGEKPINRDWICPVHTLSLPPVRHTHTIDKQETGRQSSDHSS